MQSLAGIEDNKVLMEKLEALVQKQQQLVAFAYNAIKHTKPLPKSIDQATSQERVEIPKGVTAYVWKQDPSVTRIGIRKVHLPHNVSVGPKDALIEVVKEGDDRLPGDLVAPNAANGDFLVDFSKNPFEFDCVNVYAIVRMVVDMYIRDLKIEWKWQWGSGPLRLICHAGEQPNAVYHRGKRSLKFYYYETTYLCRSLDIVASIAGHAVLDALKPSLYAVASGQAGALHDAFGDLTAMFTTLEMLDMCEDICAETKCNLRKAKYLSAIGEQFAAAMSGNSNTRSEGEGDVESGLIIGGNMNNDIKGSRCGPDVQSLASLFTGFIFDFLIAVLEWERDPARMSDGETLHRVGRVVRRILLLAIFNAKPTPGFDEIAKQMSKAVETISADDPADVGEYQRIILYLRDARELALAPGGEPNKT